MLRSFAASPTACDAADDYDVMPGGAGASSAAAPTEREISMQRGAGSKDTWVVSDGPVSTLQPAAARSAPVELSRGGGDLPSRVADNLFWLGRYAERADADRAPRAHGDRAPGRAADVDRARDGELGPLLAALRAQTRAAAAGAVAPTDAASSCGRSSASCWTRVFDDDHAGHAARGACAPTHRVGARRARSHLDRHLARPDGAASRSWRDDAERGRAAAARWARWRRGSIA